MSEFTEPYHNYKYRVKFVKIGQIVKLLQVSSPLIQYPGVLYLMLDTHCLKLILQFLFRKQIPKYTSYLILNELWK